MALPTEPVARDHDGAPARAAEELATAAVATEGPEQPATPATAEVAAGEADVHDPTPDPADRVVADDSHLAPGEPAAEVSGGAEPQPGDETPSAGADSEPPPEDAAAAAPRWRISGAGALIALLLLMLGFTLVVQVKSNTTDTTYASMREADLLTVLSDLDARRDRLQKDIASLEQTKRELASGAAGREAALAQARERADDLGILAGTLPARGPGLTLQFTGKIEAKHLLNAVQELRGAGADALQVDATGGSVRIIASTYFLDRDNGIDVDGVHLAGPYTITVIGDPRTMDTALKIRGGVVDDVTRDGGNVIVNEPGTVDIKTRHSPPNLEYAKPVS
jgi:uncharacterized protein YlxW (UPF0749 family)